MRRAFLIWVALPAAIVLGLGGGYLAGNLTDDAAAPPAATSADSGHDGHVMSDGHTMSDAEVEAMTPSAPATHGHHDGHAMPDGTVMPSSDPSTDMGGMAMDGQASSDTGGHGSHGASAESPAERPRAAVLGTFGAINAGVLVTAAMLRRRGRGRRPRRTAR